MAESAAGQNTRYSPTIINRCYSGTVKCRQLLVERVIPGSTRFVVSGVKVCQTKLVPGIKKSSCCIKDEALKIHRKQNWLKRCSITALDNAAGLGMAILTAKIVQSYIEVESFSNMWGLFSSRTVVSEGTYEVIGFAVEFFIALIAFTLTDHFMEEYRKKKNTNDTETGPAQHSKMPDETIAGEQTEGAPITERQVISINPDTVTEPGN